MGLKIVQPPADEGMRKFGDLEVGDIFRVDFMNAGAHMKIINCRPADFPDSVFNAVVLQHGQLVWVEEDTMVRELKRCELHTNERV